MPVAAIGNLSYRMFETPIPLTNKSFWLGAGTVLGIIVIVGIFALGVVYGPNIRSLFRSDVVASPSPEIQPAAAVPDPDIAELADAVVPLNGIELPITWGNLGKQLVDNGVLDRERFIDLYTSRGGLGPEEQKLIDETDNGRITMTPKNSGVLLNIFWALGLGNKNSVLDDGPMTDKQYGGAGQFASTGGWALARGDAMEHYSKHPLMKLTKDQQTLVESVSKNIYRPCCGNSTYFPDCNHGMAMLGLLELMAAQGVSEADMYKVALQVNSYWFPDTYLTLAKYLKNVKNTPWEDADPKLVLSAEYSSASGYRAIRSEIQPIQQGGGGGCGV